MTNATINLLLEDEQGQTQQAQCERFAIVMGDKLLWVQNIEGQLFIGTDVTDEDTEYTNLVLRPMATNLVSLQLEAEAIEDTETSHCCQESGCGCDH